MHRKSGNLKEWIESVKLKFRILSQAPEIESLDNRNEKFISNVALHAEEFF